MRTISYNKVQRLVRQLPAAKLERAYTMIMELTEKEEDTGSPQFELMKLPLSQRRKIMKQQAEQMAAYYKKTEVERGEWQGGEFIDEY